MRRIFLLADLCLAFGLTAPRILFAESGLIFDQTQGTLTGQLNVSSNIAAAGSVTASSATLANTAGAGLTVSSSAYLAVAGGKVGIGTTSPGAKLHVGTYGTITAPVYTINNGDGLLFDFFNVGSPYTRSGNIIASAADTSEARLSFYTKALSANPTEKVTILGNGNVGIGTTGPISKLHVNGSILSNGGGDFSVQASQAVMDWWVGAARFLSYGDATTRGKIQLIQVEGDNQNANTPIEALANGDVLLAQSIGNVGIGTTTPGNLFGSKFEVYGGQSLFRTDAAGESLIMRFANLNGTVNDNIWLEFNSKDTSSVTRSAGFIKSWITSVGASSVMTDLAFGTGQGAGSGEVMRLTSAGNVGIGTTAPGTKLSVNGALALGTENARLSEIGRRSKTSGNVDIETAYGFVSNTANFIEVRGFAPPTMYRTTEDRPAPYGIGFGNGSESGGIMPIGAGDNLQEIMFYGSNSGPTTFTWKHQVWEAGTYDPFYSNYYSAPAMSLNANTGLLYVSGNVGIGTTSPTAPLHSRLYDNAVPTLATITGLASFRLSSGTGQHNSQFLFGSSGAADNQYWIQVGKNAVAGESPTLLGGYTLRLNPLGGAVRLGGSLNVDGTGDNYIQGNVGIGTTNPTQKLDVRGNIALLAGSGLVQAQGGLALITPDDSVYGAKIWAGGGGGITFGQGAAGELMRITPGGNVGIGTTNPGAKLEVNGTVVSPQFNSFTGDTASIATNTPVTIFTAAVHGAYLVIVYLTGGQVAYHATALIINDGNTQSILNYEHTIYMDILLSGADVQLQQNSGGAQVIHYTVMRIG